MNAPPAYGPPPPVYGPAPRRPAEIAFGVVSGLLLFGALTVNAGLSFVRLFVPDGCGSSPVSGRRVCGGTGYLEVCAAPWGPPVAAVLVAGLGAAWARRRGRTPWPALLPAVLVHLTGLGFVHVSVRGSTGSKPETGRGPPRRPAGPPSHRKPSTGRRPPGQPCSCAKRSFQ